MAASPRGSHSFLILSRQIRQPDGRPNYRIELPHYYYSMMVVVMAVMVTAMVVVVRLCICRGRKEGDESA
jgi:hypothetical protein